MTAEKDLEYWLNFVSTQEEKIINEKQITFYDFKRIYEIYSNGLEDEFLRLITSLKFSFEVSNLKCEIKKERV